MKLKAEARNDKQNLETTKEEMRTSASAFLVENTVTALSTLNDISGLQSVLHATILARK